MKTKHAALRRMMALAIAIGPLATPAALAQSLKEQLIGTWKLVSSTREVGGVAQPWLFGTDSTGFLIYSADGHMCGNLMNLNRPNFPSPDMRGGTTAEKAAAFDGFLAYCGRYQVNEAGRFVLHEIQSSLFPNWTGGSQKRFIEFDGKRLALRTVPLLADGKEVVAVVTWERVR